MPLLQRGINIAAKKEVNMMAQRNSAGKSALGSLGSWLAELAAWPKAAAQYAAGKWQGLAASHHMAKAAEPLQLPEAAVKELTAAWQQLKPLDPKAAGGGALDMEAAAAPGSMPAEEAGGGGFTMGAGIGSWPNPSTQPSFGWGAAERSIIYRIREETKRLNRNNVTRTEAYRAAYWRSPELHWALLAHMVSRNGGWNMTDLQGELLPRLLPPEQREPTFQFLERANALIFQDAYPQLLLYETGKRFGRDLSHLLPAFGVSRFMRPVWAQFWQARHSVPLTVALIVNEQHYIERRVLREPYFQKKVLSTLFFGMQSLLQLNQVVFPYGWRGAAGDSHNDEDLRIAGFILESFSDIQERIEFGKRLYAVLFGIPEVRSGVLRFARTVRHTGSRADYAPQLFAPIRQGLPQRPYRERLTGGRLRADAERLYSPALADAWADVPVKPPEPGDWFRSASDAEPYFHGLPLPASFEMTNEYRFGLSKLELAVVTAQQLGVSPSR